MKIQTPRLVLRRWGPEDIDILPEIANDRSIWLNMRDVFPHPYTRENAVAWVELCAKEEELSHVFAIEFEGQAAGGIGLHPFDDVHRQTAELGYWLGTRYHGRGIATEAVGAIVQYGFEDPGFERIQACVFDGNEGSVRVLVKSGFEYEGRMRRHALKEGRFFDVLLYSRLRP